MDDPLVKSSYLDLHNLMVSIYIYEELAIHVETKPSLNSQLQFLKEGKFNEG